MKRVFWPAFNFPALPDKGARMLADSPDPIRHGTMAYALKRIREDNIPGAMAEIGVYRGETSEYLHAFAPSTRLYLFDSFAGFENSDDDRFRDTSVNFVKQRLGNLDNVEFRVGFFPDTAVGLENETFSFVSYDADKYDVALSTLEFFYPRLSPGGYFFAHDFSSPESDFAVQRAVREFLSDKPELLIELPDLGGSALFRKLRA